MNTKDSDGKTPIDFAYSEEVKNALLKGHTAFIEELDEISSPFENTLSENIDVVIISPNLDVHDNMEA